MFAIVDIGGKQYRAEEGHELVVDRLDAAEGSTVELNAILVQTRDELRLGEDQAKVTARVVEHLRGPKLVVFKFKPKRGFKRKTGFRSALTRLSVEQIA
ncbi:MAG: 50S ribosomal protein L21 [Actinobacteria bacterium]|nr:50S ribosomal protein L21 [Actinomycetota bacterium]